MLELLDDRYGHRSTLVTSQMQMDNWHALIGDPTMGDAILDRLVRNAYRIELEGKSMRNPMTKLMKVLIRTVELPQHLIGLARTRAPS